eukprot:229511-Chlamydomonas_euryale.AAC.2
MGAAHGKFHAQKRHRCARERLTGAVSKMRLSAAPLMCGMGCFANQRRHSSVDGMFCTQISGCQWLLLTTRVWMSLASVAFGCPIAAASTIAARRHSTTRMLKRRSAPTALLETAGSGWVGWVCQVWGVHLREVV